MFDPVSGLALQELNLDTVHTVLTCGDTTVVHAHLYVHMSYKFKGVNVGLVYGGYCVLLDYKVSDQKEMVATVIEPVFPRVILQAIHALD